MATFDTATGNAGVGTGGSGTFANHWPATRLPDFMTLNQGKNTGAGAAYVYWWAPGPDPTGAYYAYASSAVPWSQIGTVVVVGTRPPSLC